MTFKVVRIVPYSAVQFAANEHFKAMLDVGLPEKAYQTPRRLLAGGLAGIAAVCVVRQSHTSQLLDAN